MTVLGAVPGPSDVRWSLLSGTQRNPKFVHLIQDLQKLPAHNDQGDALLALRDLVKSFLDEHNVHRVAILQAARGQYASSPIRVKIECAVQFGAREREKEVRLVTVQSLRSNQKKFCQRMGGSPEDVFLQGDAFKSRGLLDATLVAWMGLDPDE